MKPFRLLPYLHYQTRNIFVMLGLLVLYCLWLWVLGLAGLIVEGSSASYVATLLLLPLVPASLFDLWLRLSWRQETPTIHPPPPGLLEKLFYPEYGLFWFPVLIMCPLWVWGTGLIGWVVVLWLG